MSDHFLIRLSLTTPVILSHQTTLDGILAGLILQETGDMNKALSALPLAKQAGVWCGSCIFLQSPVLTNEIVMGPRQKQMADGGSKHEFRNRQTYVRAFSTPSAYFMGEGDLAEVKRLVSGMTGIGKKRSAGYGQINISSSDFIDLANPRQQGALMLSDGTPSRPIPVPVWSEMNSQAPVMRAFVRYEPPYNVTEPVECVLPTRQQIDAASVQSLMM